MFVRALSLPSRATPRIVTRSAGCCSSRDRSTEAVVELEAAARALADDESLWGHLAAAYEKVGDTEAAWLAWRLAQSLGEPKAGEKADTLQKGLSDEGLGELWRRHLAAVQAESGR